MAKLVAKLGATKLDIHTLTDEDKAAIRRNEIVMKDHPTRVFLYEAKWPDGTVRLVSKKDIMQMLLEDREK